MLRIIVIIVLSAAAVLSGCDKIKTELERRHLGAEAHKSASSVTPDDLKTRPVNQRDVKEASERKQIIFRIDLPADEKIQIRLIKNPISEEAKSDAVVPPGDVSKEAPSLKDEVFHDKSERPAELEKKSQSKQTDAKDDQSKSEMKSDTEPESHSELKTDSVEAFPPPPVLAPTVVVPARETGSESALPDEQVKIALASKRFEPTPAEKAVGLALSGPKPETGLPTSSEPINAAPASKKTSVSNPWAIPNADYPLRYY